MKVEIKPSGVMVVRAETELESYALYKWLQDNDIPDELLVDYSFTVCEADKND